LVHLEGHSAQYSPEQVQKAKKKTPYVSKRKNWAGLRKIISQNLTTSGISRPRAATLVHNKIPLSALQKLKNVAVHFCCFCFPWISETSIWRKFRSSAWKLTELHDENNTMIFLDRLFFKKEYRIGNLSLLGITQ
jgi:hypothetical protein